MSKRRPPDDPDLLLQRLRRHLEVLGLKRLLQDLESHLAWATRESPSPSVLLERVFGEEARHRTEKRIERRIAKSGLRERKTLEIFDFDFQKDLDRGTVLELARMDFVRRNEDLIITGKPGTGKSHVLQAIALEGCKHQLSVRYTRAVDLVDDLYAGLADGTYLTRVKRWSNVQLLVIDDVGLGQVKKQKDEPTAAHMLFDLLDRRHARASTALTSNIKLGAWGKYLGDAVLAAAVLDRLSMRAIRLDIDGPSYRKKIARDRAKKRGGALPADDPGDDT